MRAGAVTEDESAVIRGFRGQIVSPLNMDLRRTSVFNTLGSSGIRLSD